MTAVDPWTVERARGTSHPSLAAASLVAAAWVLGCAGPIAAVWTQGPTQRQGSLLLAASGLVFASCLRLPVGWRVRCVAAAVALGGGLLATHFTIGGTPVLVGFSAIAVADGAVGGWPRERGPHRVPFAGLAIPFVAGAGVSWYRTTSVVVAGIVLAAGAALVALAMARPSSLATPDRWVRRVITGATSTVAAIGLWLVTVPVLYLPGAVLGFGRRLVPAGGSAHARWDTRTTDVIDHRRNDVYPFASAERRSRRLQAGVGIAITVVLVVGLAVWIRSGPKRVVRVPVAPVGAKPLQQPITPTTATTDTPAPQGVRYSQTDAGVGLPWADEVQTEQDGLPLPPGPVAGFELGDLTTRYTNTKHGERQTIAPAACSCPRSEVWVSGGSVAFGVGQRDDHTIASELVRLGDGDHRALDVHNIAVPGYSLWQEYQAVVARLAGQVGSPDAVVFYDGFNDMVYSFEQTIVNGPAFDAPVVYDPNTSTAALGAKVAELPAILRRLGGTAKLAQQAVERYSTLRELVTTQLQGLGIRVVFAYQSDFTSSPVQQASILKSYPALAPVIGPLSEFLSDAARAQPAKILNLHDVFDSQPSSVFFDLAHTNEVGARLVAEAISPVLQSALDAPVAPGPSDSTPAPLATRLLAASDFGPDWHDGIYHAGDPALCAVAHATAPTAPVETTGATASLKDHTATMQQELSRYRDAAQATAAYEALHAQIACSGGSLIDGNGGTVKVQLGPEVTVPAASVPFDAAMTKTLATTTHQGTLSLVRMGNVVMALRFFVARNAVPGTVPDFTATLRLAMRQVAAGG